MSVLPELRQRRKPEEEEEEEEEDSPVLVEREDEDDDEVEEEAEEEQDDEDKKREDALTRRLQGGFAKTPLESCCGERPGAMKVWGWGGLICSVLSWGHVGRRCVWSLAAWTVGHRFRDLD